LVHVIAVALIIVHVLLIVFKAIVLLILLVTSLEVIIHRLSTILLVILLRVPIGRLHLICAIVIITVLYHLIVNDWASTITWHVIVIDSILLLVSIVHDLLCLIHQSLPTHIGHITLHLQGWQLLFHGSLRPIVVVVCT